MNLDTIIIYILIAIVILLAAEIIRLNNRLKKIFIGKKGADLEDTISMLIRGMENLDERSGSMEKYIINIDERLKNSIQKVHTLRFNPFRDQGSNQSFATAFLNEKGDGVVFSSLYSRDKVSVYAKPISAYQSEYELSEEEQSAIDKVK